MELDTELDLKMIGWVCIYFLGARKREMANRHLNYPIRLILLGPCIAAVYFDRFLGAWVPEICSLLTLKFYQDIIDIKHCASFRCTV